MRRRLAWIVAGVLVAGSVALNGIQLPGLPTTPSGREEPVAVRPSTTPTSGATSAGQASPADRGGVVLLLGAGRAKHRATLSASGFGLLPREKIELERVTPDFPSTVLATGLTDQHGEFGGLSFKVPDAWPNGEQTVKIVGLTSKREASTTFLVESSSPGAEPNTYFGKPLTPVSFSGGGFHPGESVDVYFDSLGSDRLGRIEADERGIVHAQGIPVPPASPGDHAFLLVGRSSGAPVRVPFSVIPFSPWLAVSDYTPRPERAIGVVGNDFAAGEHVAVFLGQASGRPVAQGQADRLGVVRIYPAFDVPYSQRGKLIVVAVGTMSQAAASATITVRPYEPRLALTRYAGPPGTAVGLQGSGFAHEEKVSIHLGASDQGNRNAAVVTATTDSSGRFQLPGALRIPDRATAGKLPVAAVGEHSQAPLSVTFAVLPLAPWVNPVPAAGPANRAVALDGGGFEPSEQIELRLAGSIGGQSANVVADKNGGLRHVGSLLIPRGATGRVSIQATGTSSGAQAAAIYVVT